MEVIVVAAVCGTVGRAGACALKRSKMKKKDLKIAEERERERERREAEEAKRDLVRGLKHHTHPHPLNEVNLAGEEFSCASCKRSGRGRRYRCETKSCNFEIHRVCATSPVMLVGDLHPDSAAAEKCFMVKNVETFAHTAHVLKEVYKHGKEYKCGHCNNNGKGLRFHCDECKFDVHPICAKSPTQISSFMHPEHDLSLITRPHFTDCTICGHGSKRNNRVYACKECKFYLHPTCSEWPQYLFHELHPVLHPLQLEILSHVSSTSKCSACKKKCKRSRYHCENCRESFHPECLLRFSLEGSADGKSSEFRKKVMQETATQVLSTGINAALGLQG